MLPSSVRLSRLLRITWHDRHRAVLLLVLGGAGIALYNWHRWQHDRVLLQQHTPPPLPSLDLWPRLPRVSILVAAWNEASTIEAFLRSCAALRYPHRQIVLVAGGTDDTYARACAAAPSDALVLHQAARNGKQAALRQGLPCTDGEIVFFTDADCILDDEAFEHTVYPLATGDEQVCTGISVPTLRRNPFVVVQSAAALYSALHFPDYVTGILGRNCAVERGLLEQSRALDAPAPTGTDYVLAKELRRQGAAIRHLTSSRIASVYPTTVRGYMRQQRRWLRNVVLHGMTYGAYDEVGRAFSTSLLGLGMLLLPWVALLLGPLVLVVWLLLCGQALAARVRYLHVAAQVIPVKVTWQHVGMLVPLLLIDFVTWSMALVEYIRPTQRWRW